jgi:hypothetical protein
MCRELPHMRGFADGQALQLIGSKFDLGANPPAWQRVSGSHPAGCANFLRHSRCRMTRQKAWSQRSGPFFLSITPRGLA